MIKVLLTGAGGQLGCAIQRTFAASQFELIPISSSDIDFMSDSIEEKLSQQKFDILINCAAYTAVDKAESEQERAVKINTEAVRQLAGVCKKKNALFIHFSTDYVYAEKTPAVPLSEDDKTVPLSVYGQSKLDGEKAALTSWEKTIIIRTSWLYGDEGNNFVKTMLRLAQNKNAINVVFDQIGSPTYAGDLASAVEIIVQQSLHENFTAYGIFNFSNEGVCSWYDFAKEIFRLQGIAIEVHPVLSDQFKTAAKRPHYSVLQKQKIKETFDLSIPHWQDSLMAFFRKGK